MSTTDGITVFINAIRDLSGVGICYYDLNAFFNYNKYGAKNNRGHYCAFCEKVRSLPNGRQYCEKSDRTNSIILAKQYKEPFFFECHMGMRELVIPLIREEVLLGILFVGQCRIDNNYGTVIQANAKRMKGDPDEMLRLYNQLPLIPQNDLLNIGKILSQYFDTKILNNEVFTGSNPHIINRDLAQSIRSFITLNYRYDVSPKEIARVFYVNASYASRCFSQRYHITITEYISHVRMERAKMLLLTTEASVGNIALNVGFGDVNYFSRVFKKKVGCSPSQYRKRER